MAFVASEIALSCRNVDVVRGLVDIDEDGPSAQAHDNARRREEGVGRGEDFIALAYAKGHQTHQERIGGGRSAHPKPTPERRAISTSSFSTDSPRM